MRNRLSNPLETVEATIGLVSRVQRRMLETCVADLGINLTQSLITSYLAYVAEQGAAPMNQTELAQCLSLKKPATGAALDVLAARGFVRKTTAPDDRRAVLVQITEEGRAFADDIEQRMQAVRAAIEAGISEREMAAFVRTLEKILGNLNSLSGVLSRGNGSTGADDDA